MVGGLEHFSFPHILEIIMPTDFHIFQMARSSTNQQCEKIILGMMIWKLWWWLLVSWYVQSCGRWAAAGAIHAGIGPQIQLAPGPGAFQAGLWWWKGLDCGSYIDDIQVWRWIYMWFWEFGWVGWHTFRCPDGPKETAQDGTAGAKNQLVKRLAYLGISCPVVPGWKMLQDLHEQWQQQDGPAVDFGTLHGGTRWQTLKVSSMSEMMRQDEHPSTQKILKNIKKMI